MNKIFQIGFNKCGTSSIHNLFQKYTNLKSIHWDKGFLAKTLHEKIIFNQKPILTEKYSEYDIFTDMESIFIENKKTKIVHAYEYFKILDNYHPGSKFILNTRQFDGWLESRLKHEVRSIILNNNIVILKKPVLYWRIYCKIHKINKKNDLICLWKNQWETHHKNVKEYFINRSQDLLVYNIDLEKNLDKFKNFFPQIKFNTNILPIINKTK